MTIHDSPKKSKPLAIADALRAQAAALVAVADALDDDDAPEVDPLVGADDWEAYHAASRAAFAAILRTVPESMRVGHRRVAPRSAILAYLAGRRKVVAPPESGESIDTIYARLAGGSK
ncbi:MAG: hypothetical protein ABI551_20915 [Polyangiaceae bacterium]